MGFLGVGVAIGLWVGVFVGICILVGVSSKMVLGASIKGDLVETPDTSVLLSFPSMIILVPTITRKIEDKRPNMIPKLCLSNSLTNSRLIWNNEGLNCPIIKSITDTKKSKKNNLVNI